MSRPSIAIAFESAGYHFLPGDFLSGEYRIDLPHDATVNAIEASIIWMTHGKGETDIGVHFFQRRQKETLPRSVLSQPQRFSTVLPASPLTYEGRILNVCWLVRVRVFLTDGQQITEDHPFQLGTVKPFPKVASTSDDSTDTSGNSVASEPAGEEEP